MASEPRPGPLARSCRPLTGAAVGVAARSGRPCSCGATCWIYGLGGLVAPFVGIKLPDLLIHNVLGA